MRKTCSRCGGSGKMMGGGMMQVQCNNHECENGFVYISDKSEVKVKNNKPKKMDRRSKQYKSAIKELKDLGMSEEEAHKQFAEAEKDFNQENVD